MFSDSPKDKKKSDKDGLAQKSSRGNMEEYEALRTIIAENPGLLTRVLDKIRVHRSLGKATVKSPTEAELAKSDGDNKK